MGTMRQRAIFTNDAECDDMNSLVHLLLCANDIDIEGIVLSSSIYHYAGDPASGLDPYRWAGGDWMWEYLDEYERVWPNLVRHDPAYPTADELRAVTCIGNIKSIGDMAEPTDGSELIRRAIFSDDPRPIWLLAGGGTNTIARALLSIEEAHKGTNQWGEVYRQVCEKSRIFMIVTQDDTYKDYIAGTWPDLPMLHATSIKGVAFHIDETTCPPEALEVFSGAWLKSHILERGALCAHYHTWFDGHVYPGEVEKVQYGSNMRLKDPAYIGGRKPKSQYDMISEGDSPSFLHLIDTGLRQLEDPSWGGWGGRFRRNPSNEFNGAADYWESSVDADFGPTQGSTYELSRWVADWMHDFAARAAWCVTDSYEGANHRPSVEVAEGTNLTVSPGETVVLTALGSDPDNDKLVYTWFDYPEAGTYGRPVAITQDGNVATFCVPADARPGDTIHVIVRVSDGADGRDDYLVSYARVVVTVG